MENLYEMESYERDECDEKDPLRSGPQLTIHNGEKSFWEVSVKL